MEPESEGQHDRGSIRRPLLSKVVYTWLTQVASSVDLRYERRAKGWFDGPCPPAAAPGRGLFSRRRKNDSVAR